VLITHHVEEIIPEMDRVIFLKDGRAAGDGDKASLLTAERLTWLFGGPLSVGERGGYYFTQFGPGGNDPAQAGSHT
jgi:iron complex transport system ATP-binding protein